MSQTGDKDMNENTAYSIWCELLRMHKAYSRIEPVDGLAQLTTEINKVNMRYSLPFCNALTGILFDWYRVGFKGLEADNIVGFYRDMWSLHHKYMLQTDRNEAFWDSMYKEIKQIQHKYPFKMFERYIFVICDSVELGNALCTDGQQQAS